MPTFTKLYGRNGVEVMKAGRYQITIYSSKPFKISAVPVGSKLLDRLPCQTVWRDEIDSDIHSLVGRREESVPWLGVCRC